MLHLFFFTNSWKTKETHQNFQQMLLLQEMVSERCGSRKILQRGVGFDVGFKVNL